MAARVTERWSDRQWSVGKTGRRAFDVDQVSDEGEAETAVGLVDGDTFPEDARLILDDVDVSRTGPRCFRVTASYKFYPAGDRPPLADNPLDRPIEWGWQRAETSEPADVDAYGTPITNAAGFPFNPTPTNDFPYRVLTATRWESTYDLSKAEAYENHTNSDTVHIPLTPGDVAAGRILCKTYEPVSPYTVRSTYLQVRYTFHLRAGWTLDTDGVWDAWKWRLLNAGLSGWWNDGGTKRPGAFVYKKSRERVTEPVLLATDGTPLNAGFEVESGPGTTAAAVAAPNTLSSVLIENGGNAYYLKYRKRKTAAFAGLSLF